ncbi:hypothetical protein NR798_12665 [Archangium gephyra]|uniref:hypothetical protein n=1 Tax=Archangium gephyra TaxID=48 RepID=UPI0035D4A1C7
MKTNVLSAHPRGWEGPAALVGGLLWLVSYGADLAFGLQTGHEPTDASASGLAALSATTFSLGLACLGFTMVRLGARLRAHSPWAGTAGLLLGAVVLASGIISAIALSGLLGSLRNLKVAVVPGVLSYFGGTTLLGATGLRAPAASHRTAACLLAAGFLTPVLVAATTLPLPPGLPSYVVANLPFALAGATWLAIGTSLRRDPAGLLSLPSPG